MQLGPSGAEDEQRHSARPVDEVVDEVEQIRRRPSAGPRRPATSGRGSASASRKRRQAAKASSAGCAGELLVGSGGRRAGGGDARASTTSVGSATCDSIAVEQLGRRALGVVALEDPRLRLHDLGQRPEADALAVRAGDAPWRQLNSSGSCSSGSEELVERAWLLPIPGTPTSVTSCGSRSSRTRATAATRAAELAVPADERPELGRMSTSECARASTSQAELWLRLCPSAWTGVASP